MARNTEMWIHLCSVIYYSWHRSLSSTIRCNINLAKGIRRVLCMKLSLIKLIVCVVGDCDMGISCRPCFMYASNLEVAPQMIEGYVVK